MTSARSSRGSLRLIGAVPAVVLGGSAALAVVGLTDRLASRLRTLGRIG